MYSVDRLAHSFSTKSTYLFVTFILICTSSESHARVQWIWKDTFSMHEQKELMNWITHAGHGMTALFGNLPYPYKVYFYHSNEGHGPCPWAHTRKYLDREVHFYVNTSYSLDTFKQDWTASHELSHLMFPYLGRKDMWFAEGIATYLQYQIMYANDTLNWNQVIDKIQQRLDKARSYKKFDKTSILELSSYSRDTSNKKYFEMDSNYYVRLYWGGAAYFLYVDEKLYKEKKIRLQDVIHTYINHPEFQYYSTAAVMMQTFNQLSNTDIFTETFKDIIVKQGFPTTHTQMTWLSNHPPSFHYN